MPKSALSLADLPVALDTAPMEAKSAEVLPKGDGWQFEPKWDGFRCLAFRAGGEVALRAKSGKPLDRYFPEMTAALAALPHDRFVLDGELTITVDGASSFEALQMRLHPAESRVRKLAAETPARLVAFDLLVDARGRDLMDQPLSARRPALEAFHAGLDGGPGVDLSPFTLTRAEACAWLEEAGARLDGVMAKRLDQSYRPGERAMIKVKRLRTADCVVGGFRYLAARREVGSLLLGLYDDGLLHHIGFTSAFGEEDRGELTERLEALAGGTGFTGRSPGGPSRWSTERSGDWVALRPELVVEVRFDHVTGDRLRHGARFLRWRPDKRPDQCRMEQIRALA